MQDTHMFALLEYDDQLLGGVGGEFGLGQLRQSAEPVGPQFGALLGWLDAPREALSQVIHGTHASLLDALGQ